MTSLPQQYARNAKTERQHPHLVIKRGHHGRYRFALLTDQGRMTGQVLIDAGGDRELARLQAVEKISTLARTLEAALTDARGCLDASLDACEIGQTEKVASDPIVEGHHGQI